MKKIVNLLIKIYKKYGYLFQGKLFSAIVLFYKKSRILTPFETFKYVLSNFCKIKVYGGRKEKAIEKVLKNAEFDSEGCEHFIYTWDVFKSVKIKARILGNCTIDYSKIIDNGLDTFYLDGDDEFASINNITLDAILSYLDRLTKYVESSSITNKGNITLYLKRFRTQRAETLEEALQRILIINQIQWQLGHILVGLGRLDLYLNRFINISSPEEDRELFDEFFLLLHKYFAIKSNALMGDTGQIVILGGLNADDTYFCNQYTSAIMDSIRKLQKPDPKVLLRISSKMPDSLWEKVTETMISNIGSPLISNDDQIVKELTNFGYSKEDACNYITAACWEPIVGESFEQNNIISLNYLEPFEIISKKENLKDIVSLEILKKKYFKALEEYIKEILDFLSSIRWQTDPLYSMFSLNARQQRQDISCGGSKYNNYGILTVGMANVVNSFYNINEYVFKQKKYTYDELDYLRKRNFKNDKDYMLLKNSPKKFGHDDESVIKLVNEITHKTQDLIKDYRNYLSGKVKFGLSSPHYIMDSADFPASFDGRKCREPFSVHISCSDAVAYTELMSFASALNYSGHRFNSNVVDYIVSPSFVKNNFQKFKTFLKSAFEQGVFQMQANIIDSKTLIAAKENPKNFPNLIVRVWGFNAYFNELPEEYKDCLIERALQSELTFN